ncbi:alpha/beta fold hydrolase [Actinomycetospora atypica]|uniref:Alpha/beta fold hydrolase n=1 Tax=Actinomycetospora atypica TaxID=1290095 RepID=A0ABV9YJ68_9PSEU
MTRSVDDAREPEAGPVVVELDRPAPTPVELTVWPAADPAAPAYVVVPAMGMRASFYAPLLQALARGGVHAGVLELRGHQRAAAPLPGRRYDFGYADLVEDLSAAVLAVREKWPDARVVTLGHSFGGHVATAQAAAHPAAGDPARPDALALVATGSVAWRAWGRLAPWHLLRSQALLVLTTVVGHFPGQRVGFAGREARTQMTEWARWSRTGRFVVGSSSGAAGLDVDAGAARVDVPVLAVSFEGDPLAPRSTTTALAGLFTGAPVTLEHHALPVGRPHVDWVRQPQLFSDRLHRWATGAA